MRRWEALAAGEITKARLREGFPNEALATASCLTSREFTMDKQLCNVASYLPRLLSRAHRPVLIVKRRRALQSVWLLLTIRLANTKPIGSYIAYHASFNRSPLARTLSQARPPPQPGSPRFASPPAQLPAALKQLLQITLSFVPLIGTGVKSHPPSGS